MEENLGSEKKKERMGETSRPIGGWGNLPLAEQAELMRVYKEQIRTLVANWKTTERLKKQEAVVEFIRKGSRYLNFKKCTEDLEEEFKLWKELSGLMDTEHKEILAEIQDNELVFYNSRDEIMKIPGVENMLKSDTQIPDNTKQALQHDINYIRKPNNEDNKFIQWFGLLEYMSQFDIDVIYQMLDSDKKIPYDAKFWIARKINSRDQALKDVRKQEGDPQPTEAHYKSLTEQFNYASNQISQLRPSAFAYRQCCHAGEHLVTVLRANLFHLQDSSEHKVLEKQNKKKRAY